MNRRFARVSIRRYGFGLSPQRLRDAPPEGGYRFVERDVIGVLQFGVIAFTFGFGLAGLLYIYGPPQDTFEIVLHSFLAFTSIILGVIAVLRYRACRELVFDRVRAEYAITQRNGFGAVVDEQRSRTAEVRLHPVKLTRSSLRPWVGFAVVCGVDGFEFVMCTFKRESRCMQFIESLPAELRGCYRGVGPAINRFVH